jgi:putative transposase
MQPNAAQREALSRNAGSRRWVWNWALGRKQSYYREHGKGLRTSILKSELPVLKREPETAWLAKADSQSLQETWTGRSRTSSKDGRASLDSRAANATRQGSAFRRG